MAGPAGAPTPTGGGAQRTVSPEVSAGAFTFHNIMSETRSRWLKALFYGPPGGGKTTLTGSATNIEAMQDVLLITAEGGDIVFFDNDRVQHPENIDLLKLERIEQLQKVFEFLQHHIRARDTNNEAMLKKLQAQVFGVPEDQIDRVRRFRTVILDSLTDIEALNMNKILGTGDGFQVGDDFEAPGWTEFRKNNNTIQAVVRSFRNLDVHLLVICGQKWTQDEQKKFHYVPWLSGQLSVQIQSFVDLVGYHIPSGADPQQPDLRRLYVQPLAGGARFDAKCRGAAIKKAWYDNPTLEDIMKDFRLL
jgi:hypothetical protein